MTTYKRPLVLEQTLFYLKLAVREYESRGWGEPIVFVANQDGTDDRVCELLQAFSAEVDSFLYLQHIEPLGLQANTYNVLVRAFDKAKRSGDQFVLHLEDDLLVAPDTLLLASWMRDTYAEDASVPFIGMKNVEDPPLEPREYLRLQRTDWFGCHVWGTWLDVWERELEPAWNHENRDYWAVTVNDCVMQGRDQVIPRLSRVLNAGAVGTHNTPESPVRETQLFAGFVEVPEGPYWERGRVPEEVRTQA